MSKLIVYEHFSGKKSLYTVIIIIIEASSLLGMATDPRQRAAGGEQQQIVLLRLVEAQNSLACWSTTSTASISTLSSLIAIRGQVRSSWWASS